MGILAFNLQEIMILNSIWIRDVILFFQNSGNNTVFQQEFEMRASLFQLYHGEKKHKLDEIIMMITSLY